MPAHRNALKQLLASSEQQALILERRLLWSTDDAERSELIDKLAELHLTQANLKAALLGEDL
jgi:hypothetical protein